MPIPTLFISLFTLISGVLVAMTAIRHEELGNRNWDTNCVICQGGLGD